MNTLDRFSLVAMCPSCGAVDTHDMMAPHFQPPLPSPDDRSPLARNQRFIANIMESFEVLTLCGPLFDPPGTQVARICRACQHRWGQR